MLFTSLILVLVVATQAFAAQPLFQAQQPPAPSASLAGIWRVSFTFGGDIERHLTFDSQAKGVGSFLLLDTRPDNKPEPAPLPAVWSQLTNGRVSLSGEVELPYSTCCREIGTLILKGKFDSDNSIKGKAIFIASTEDGENLIGYRSMLGKFTATRELQ